MSTIAELRASHERRILWLLGSQKTFTDWSPTGIAEALIIPSSIAGAALADLARREIIRHVAPCEGVQMYRVAGHDTA